MGGKVGFNEESIRREFYEEIPHGLLTKFHRIQKPENGGSLNILKMNLVSKFHRKNYRKAWKTIHKYLKFDGSALARKAEKDVIDAFKYSEETWESTVYIDYWDHRLDSTSYLLDRVTTCKESALDLKTKMMDFNPDLLRKNKRLAKIIKDEENICTNTIQHVMVLANVTKVYEEYFLERAEREKAGVTFGVPVTASFYKNVGIAYSRIVQAKVDLPDGATEHGYPLHKNVYQMHKKDDSDYDYKNHASLRTLETWKLFLEMPAAKKDSSYATILNVVNYLQNMDAKNGAKPQGQKGASVEKPKQRKKKRKKKRTAKKKKKSKMQ